MVNQFQPQQPIQNQPQPQPQQPVQPQPQPNQPPPAQPLPPVQPQPAAGKGHKSCWIACIVTLSIFIVLGILAWFVFRPMFFRWLCSKGAQEQGIIKIDEESYYNGCLKKYHIQ